MFFDDVFEVQIVYLRNKPKSKSGWLILYTPEDPKMKPEYEFFINKTKKEMEGHLIKLCYYNAMDEAFEKFRENEFPPILLFKTCQSTQKKRIIIASHTSSNILLSTDGIWYWLKHEKFKYSSVEEKLLTEIFDIMPIEAGFILDKHNKLVDRRRAILKKTKLG